MQIAEYLESLINIPSVTGGEDALCNKIALDMEALGFQTTFQKVVGDRRNLLASRSDGPRIILTTHLDTVPPFIPSTRKEGKIFGRGACDAKGQIAAAILAVDSLPTDLRDKVAILLVVGEEVDSIGARTAVADGMDVQFFINCEPTDNICASCQKGVLIFRMRSDGKAAHSGYPEAGRSAIELLVKQLNILSDMTWGEDEKFGTGTFNAGKISGGHAANVIAPFAEADCAIRIVTSCADILQRINACVLPGISFEVLTHSEPLELFVPRGFESEKVNFGSDSVYYSQCATTLMLGPGSILHAHAHDEHILISELEKAVELYKRLIKTLLNSTHCPVWK